jgi:hypothetical protein
MSMVGGIRQVLSVIVPGKTAGSGPTPVILFSVGTLQLTVPGCSMSMFAWGVQQSVGIEEMVAWPSAVDQGMLDSKAQRAGCWDNLMMAKGADLLAVLFCSSVSRSRETVLTILSKSKVSILSPYAPSRISSTYWHAPQDMVLATAPL